MFIISGSRWKHLPKMVHIFFRTYLDFELIQPYLNWSYLNAIYILDAPKMLEIVKGHRNNSDGTHNYFQDFMKWFSIITKPKQRNKIEKQKTEERENLPVAYLAQPTYLMAQLPGPAHYRRRPPGASRPGVWPACAHGRASTPPACLALPSPARRRG